MPLPSAQQRLDEALAARHALLTGNKTASVGFGQRSVTYTEANIKDLDRYIAELRREIARTRPVRNRINYVVPD